MAEAPADSAAEIQEQLGVEVDPQLLRLALVHRSYAYENGGLPTNERLEFLGDAVLGLVVTDTLYASFPDLPEGQLAKYRSAVVNMRALALVSRRVGLGRHVLLGRGEEATGGRDKDSILADTLEAVLGATYLSVGIQQASEVVHRLIYPLISEAARLGAGLDWKTSLQERTAALGLGVPSYAITSDGPDHAKVFEATVMVDHHPMGRGTGRSKKVAEQNAAQRAWAKLKHGEESGPAQEGVVPTLSGSNSLISGAGGTRGVGVDAPSSNGSATPDSGGPDPRPGESPATPREAAGSGVNGSRSTGSVPDSAGPNGSDAAGVAGCAGTGWPDDAAGSRPAR
ncbi:MAG: ribonuclease III [Actinomycetales bacterium]